MKIVKMWWFVLLAMPLLAHKLNVFALPGDGVLYLESYFASGSPCQKCEFSIKQEDQVLYQGQLDAAGQMEIPWHTSPPFTVFVDAGMGHAASTEVSAPEGGVSEKAAPDDPQAASSPVPAGMDEEKWRSMIRSEVAHALLPIRADLQKQQDAPPLSPLSAGGYLIGFFAILYFLKSRQ